MSFNNQQPQPPQDLQERLRFLQKQIEEKDEAYFELSATLAAVQAESSYAVKTMEKKTKIQLDRTSEELRRTTQEANQAHMALARLQQQRSLAATVPIRHNFQQPTAVGPESNDMPPSTIFITEAAPANSPTSVAISQQQKTGQALARHLLLQGPMRKPHDSIYNLLQHAQHSELHDTDIVWQIMQSSGEHNKLWLKGALLWSATSRSTLRQACITVDASSTRDGTMTLEPRIQISTDAVDLQAITERLRNPLWQPSPSPISPPPSKSNPFDPSICQAWMEEICSDSELWFLIAPLFHDCDSSAEQSPWLVLLSKDLISQWEAFAQEHMPKDQPRRVHAITPFDTAMSISPFLQSLQLMSDVFKKLPAVMDRAVMAIMLDLLEYETFLEKRNVTLIITILSFLSTLAEDTEGLKLLRTKMVTSEEETAQSGLGVAIVILTVAQLNLEELSMDGGELNYHVPEYKRLEMMRNHVIRLFHQVLRHRTKNVCFTSLIDERKHDYLGVCSQILVAPKERTDSSIRTMVRLQVEEVDADRYEEEDLKLKQK
jgi:hypothetical protein